MLKGQLTSLTASFARFFSERQFYHRSKGEVHFISISGKTQLAYIALTLAFLTWVGYSSVNVVFTEQIISEKTKDLVAMQQQYERRLADLQLAYDLVNARITAERDSFRAEMRKWNVQLEKLEALTDIRADFASALNGHLQTYSQNHYLADNQTKGSDVSRKYEVRKELTEPESATHMSRRSAAGKSNRIADITAQSREFIRYKTIGGDSTQALSELKNRLASLEERRDGFMNLLSEKSRQRTAKAEEIIKRTGLNLEAVRKQFSAVTTAEGGPFIALRGLDSLRDSTSHGELDTAFQKQMFHLANEVEHVLVLEKALMHIPLIVPVNDSYRITSKYGARIDPFTRRSAFHSGTDIAGRAGSAIMAPAPGVVTYAGSMGPYGNLIEIDHGYGLKTRYGHLRKLKVKKGDNVDFYQQIASMGSTGRSTGPHLHYEIWFDRKVKDPAEFFAAGDYVFKK